MGIRTNFLSTFNTYRVILFFLNGPSIMTSFTSNLYWRCLATSIGSSFSKSTLILYHNYFTFSLLSFLTLLIIYACFRILDQTKYGYS